MDNWSGVEVEGLSGYVTASFDFFGDDPQSENTTSLTIAGDVSDVLVAAAAFAAERDCTGYALTDVED